MNMRRLLFSFSILLLVASDSYAAVKPSYGVDLRMRYEIWQHMIDFGALDLENENYFRLKTSPWVRLDFSEKLGLYIKLTNEAKYYISSYNPDNSGVQGDELTFESFFLDVKNAAGLPVDLRIGRQDLKYGDGFLIWDGTPVAADRTKHFDAAKATWRINQKHSIDFLYIHNPKTDNLLPSLHPAKSGRLHEDNLRILRSSDEKAFIVYGNNHINESMAFEPYYIYKQEERIDARNPRLDLKTIGSRIVYSFTPWKFKGEFAHEFGEYDGGRKRRGNGGSIFITRSFEDARWMPEIEAGYVNLSGDDPDTQTNEGWDPLFSRWKWLSGLYKYAYLRETGIGSYWTNLELYRSRIKLSFTPNTDLSLAYNYLKAGKNTNITGPNAAIFSNNGKERGHLQQAVLHHRFTGKINGTMVFEYFIPGNFYSNKSRDAYYLTWELQVHI